MYIHKHRLLYLLYHLSSLSTFSLPWSYVDFIEKFFEKNKNFFFGIRKHPQNVKDISEALHISFNDINQTIIVKKKNVYIKLITVTVSAYKELF